MHKFQTKRILVWKRFTFSSIEFTWVCPWRIEAEKKKIRHIISIITNWILCVGVFSRKVILNVFKNNLTLLNPNYWSPNNMSSTVHVRDESLVPEYAADINEPITKSWIFCQITEDNRRNVCFCRYSYHSLVSSVFSAVWGFFGSN